MRPGLPVSELDEKQLIFLVVRNNRQDYCYYRLFSAFNARMTLKNTNSTNEKYCQICSQKDCLKNVAFGKCAFSVYSLDLHVYLVWTRQRTSGTYIYLTQSSKNVLVSRQHTTSTCFKNRIALTLVVIAVVAATTVVSIESEYTPCH
jgi:hypothetical protein